MPYTTPGVGPTHTLHIGDALSVLPALAEKSIDAIVTDPPYAIKRLSPSLFDEPATGQDTCMEAGCTPGGPCRACTATSHANKFSRTPMLGQQSQNWHAKETHSRGYADNDPRQFQTWCSLWLAESLRVLKPGGHLVAFGGTRTWHRLAVAAEDSGFEIRDNLAWIYSSGMPKSLNVRRAVAQSRHDVDDHPWEGWGTGLKPAFEPIVLARRPLEGTMADNIAAWGLGPLNLTRPTDEPRHRQTSSPGSAGKWPSNVHLDSTQSRRASGARGQDAEQFFWVSKPSKAERVVVDGVAHPTVKPLDLMRRLVRLVTPPGGVVLDPFAGSGTTIEASLLEGLSVIGVEREPAYESLIAQRVARTKSITPSQRQSTPPERLF